jgi:hypothetical protein
VQSVATLTAIPSVLLLMQIVKTQMELYAFPVIMDLPFKITFASNQLTNLLTIPYVQNGTGRFALNALVGLI